MAENIYRKSLNTESPLLNSTGTPSEEATNEGTQSATFKWDDYLTPYNETEKGEQANVESTQKVETPTTPKESPLSPSEDTPKEVTPKAEAEPMKFDIPTIEGYKEKPTAPTLTTAKTSVVSTPIRKSYKNFYDEYMDVAKHNYMLAQTQGRTTSQIFADMAKRLTPEGMVQSFSEMNAMRYRAEQYAAAMSTTATDYGIEKTLSEKMSGWKSDKKLFEVDEILSQLEKTDGDGNKFYQFYGGEIYGDAARKIVKSYVDEHNHWVNMRDKDYRERWSMAEYGIPYEEFADRRMEVKINPALQKLRVAQSAYYNSDEYEMQEEWRRNLSSLDDGFGTYDKDDNLALATQTTFARANSFKDATFANGLIEGMFPAIKSMLPGGVGAMDDAALMSEQVIALDKRIKGEPLSKREEYLVALWEANEIIDEETNLYRKGANWAKTASTGLQGIGFSAGIATSGAQQLGNMLGKKLLGEAAEQSALKILKEQGFKTAIKMTAKAAPKKLAVSTATSAVKAGASSMTARNFAEDRLDQFKMTQLGLMKEEKNPLASLWKAYAMSFGEWFTEDLGDIADDIFSLGRRAALNKAFSGKLSKALTRLDDFKATSAVRNFLRDARIQGLTAEAGSELLNNYIQPLLTGEFFWDISQDGFMSAANKHYSDVLTWESTWDTITQSAIIAGTGMMSRGISGAMQGWQISSLRNQIREALEDVQNEGLRNQLYELINSDTPNFTPLAGINWKSEGINVEDAQRAMQVVFKSAQVQEMRGEFEETQRLAAFAPQLQYILQRAYKGAYEGVDTEVPTETETLEEIAIKKGDNTFGYVLFGNIDDTNQVLLIVDGNGQTHNVTTGSLKADGYEFDRKSIGDAITEQYALMFSNQISQERLGEVIESVRGYRGADAETKQRIIEANGFSVYKNGSAVTLVDGRMAVVKGNAENGQYTVDILGADGKVADTAMVGFEYIINENDPKMAQAQMDAQARGALGSPIVLPTKEGGRISLDEINDSQTLADLLPSQVGGKAKAVAVIDAEIERLKAMQGSQSKGVGLDAVADNVQQAETIANRIAVLEDTRKRLGGAPKAQPKTREEVEKENEARQAEQDSMSTFDFSQNYRRRMGNTKVSRNALKTFINNIDEGLAVLDETLKDNETAIAKKEAEISNTFSRATSEVDLERIAEEQKTAIAKLNTLKAERAEMEADRKKMQHRKAQYEQALKDMGGNTDTKYQEGTIGADKKIFEFAEKASKILGMPVVVTEKEFTSNRQGGLHRVEEDGKRAIYINPNSTAAEQGVGILAHEIGHEFKKVLTPEEWAKFEDLVLTARFGKDWANSEAYKKEIEGIQNAEKSVNGQGISDTKAREEAVTYAIQNFIFDGERGARAFEAILNQDLNWRDKLMEVFRKVVDKLKSLFNVEKPTEQDLAVQSAIEEFGNIFKRCAKKSGEIKAEQIEGETAAIINEKDGQSSFSLSTYEDGGRDILQNFLDSQVEGGKLDQKDANAILTEMDAIYDICMDYKDEYAPFGAWSDAAVVRDEEGMPVFSVIKANGDYAMNLDFSLVCKKRRTLDAVLNEMIGRKLIEIAPDDPTFIAKVNDIVRKYGFETACRLCFVDAKRFRVVSTARNFCKLYNGVVAKLMPTDKKVAINSFDAAGVGYPTHEGSLDTLADSELNIKALEDILKRNGEKTVIAKIARHLLEHPEDRKLVHISDFVSTRGFDPTKALNPQILSLYNSKKGSGGPKASFSDVQYLNDVIYADWNKEDAYAVGGVRVQSFSDYVPRMVFDYMQMVADLAAKQMPVHAYTKEAAFAKTFGLTGMKINMSLVPTVVEGGVAAGLDADGNYAWEEGETFDYDTAIEIQNADGYRENCGTIAVGVSDEHIDKMLDDDNIRMVIPYHKSGLNKAVAIANNIDAFKDYTNQQNTRYADGTKLSSADSKNVPNFNEDTRRLGDPRKAADAYLAWCKENNYKPKFDKWASHPNYYKLLEDFTTLVDGEYFEQRGVTMTFPKEDDAFGSLSNLIAESLEEDAVLEGKRDSLVGAMVDEIESTLFSNREKALESSNSLQKRPNTQEVVSGADVAESYSISRNNEATIDKWLGKREDFTDDIKSAFKEYIADFKPATQLATTKWFANGVIRIPEDMPKVEQAMEIAQRKKVDALQYNSPMELIDQFGDVFKPKAKLINPDDVPTLSNKVQVPNTDITIYDVEDSEESRKNFRELMNSHLGKDANPWCLMQAEDGVLRADSKDYWEKYNKYQRRAAFKGGKLIAFFASDGEPTWWDRMDQPHDHIPIVGKIKGDELGRTATLLYNEENGEMVGYDDIRKGARGDAYYAEWYDLDTMKEESRYDKATGNGSERYFYEDGSVELYKVIEVDREMQRVHFDRQGNVTSQTESNGRLDYSSVWQDGAKQKISIDGRGQYLRIEWDDSDVKGLDYSSQGKRELFTFETNAYKSEETNLQKRYLWSYGSNEWMFRRSKLLRVTTNKEYKAAIFEDRTSVEIKNIGENYATTLERLPVGDVVYYIDITNSNDGQHEKVDIENVGSINDGVRVLNEGVTDALVDEIMAEVKQRLDIVDRVASDINKDSEMQRKRSAKLAQMYHPDNVSDVRSLDEANILLDKARADITSTKDSFSIDRSQSADNLASLAESEGTTSYSIVRDEAKIAELEASAKRIGYRNVILNEDGSFSSPMATHIGNTGKGKVKSATFNLGEWEEAEENPQLVDEKGQVVIYKDNGKPTRVAYDPYIHNRLDKVNAQFKEAWKRPNLVYVETEVPITDLESGYHADKAKLSVGVHPWSNGDLMLSRYDKPIRIVPWEEVADDWVARFKDTGVEFDIVPPALLPILKERGVEILPPHKGLGADATEAYEASRTEQESFSLVRPTDEEVTFDNFYTNTSVVFEKVSETPTGRPDFVSKSGSRYWYGEDEGGKYVIRQSDHWSANVTTEEAKDAFNSKPDNYNNIASCYWALEGAENQPTTIELGTINKANVLNVDYNTDTHRLTITLKGGRRVYRDGVSVRDMRKYFNLMKSQGATAANDYVVDMVNEKYAEVVKPADKVQIGKAYLTDFTKWEVEPRESFSILREEDTDTIFATAKEEFASTNDWKKTGWLMPDGTQLDFAEGGDYRGTDHRAIGAAYKGVAEHQWQYLQDFESRGGIRIHMNRDGKYGTIEMTIKPTAEQKKKLRSFIGAVGGNVDVDFMDENYNTAHSASYEGVSPARVLSGITSFYDEGIKPKGNVSYSVSREDVDIKPIGEGAFGPIYDQFRGKPQEAVDFLLAEKNGEAIGALTHPEIGDVSLVYGNEFAGLEKIAQKHPEVLQDIQGVLDTTKVKQSSDNRIVLEGPSHKVVVSKMLGQKETPQWLLTAYEKNSATGGSSDIDPEPTSGKQNGTATLQSTASENKDTTTNPKNQISEQESYSLNRDDVTIATPEMEAEANEELSKEEMERNEVAIKEVEKALQIFEDKIAKQDRKKFTYDVVRDFIKAEQNRTGLQGATRGQYNAILENILDILEAEDTDRSRISKGELLATIKLALTNARLKLATSNLTKAGKDFKKVITKKREGKNTRGEARQKYVSDEVRLIVEEFINTVNVLFAEQKDGKTIYRYDDVMRAGALLVDSEGKILDPINKAILNLEERVDEGDAFAKGVVNLLDVFSKVRELASRINGTRNEATIIDTKMKSLVDEFRETENLERSINVVRQGNRGWQSAWRAIRRRGFATIEQAEARLAELQQEAEAKSFELALLRGDKHMIKSIEADLMNELVEAVRDMNTAINSVDKEGRVALKEELAKKKEADIEFKRGILRSIRSPYYINAVKEGRHNTKRNKGQLTRSQRRDMLRRGDGFLDAIVDSLEYVLRKMDRMSMPNQWLQTGIYYQFIMHPTQGILARADWRYKTEKALREMLNKKATEMLAPKGVGSITIEDLNLKLKEESGIIINPYRSNLKGEAVSSSAVALPINLTVDQLLYIRAMVAQDGGIKGYLTLGLTVDQVNSIIKETEARYPELCAFDDWIRGEGGFLDEVYKIRNEIYRKLYGRDLPHTKGYFPIQRLAMALHSDESVGETISISTIAGGIGSNKERVQNALPMDINVGYFEKLEKHITESMQWCQEIELVEKMNVLLSSPMFRDILKEQGITKEKFKNAFLRGIGERLGEGNSKNQTFNRIISSATKHIVAANVSFNLNAALKQLVSSTAAFSQELNPKLWAHFAKNFLVPTFARSGVSAIKKTLEDDISIDQVVSMPLAFGCWKWARENMPTFAERIDSGTLGYEIFEQDGIETWDWINSYINKVGLLANRFFDLLTCSVVGKTYYDFWKERNLERGMTEQEAHDDARMRAAVLVNQTQQSSLGAFLGKIQADKGDTVTALWRAVIVSYNNSNISFDRNTRAATIALNTMIHDTFVDPKVRNKIIEYKAEEYVSRGIEEEDAKELARKDYTESFFTQLNQFVHNGILNHIFWAIGGHMSTILPHIPMLLGAISNHYDEDDEALSYEYIKKQLLETLKGGWIYLAPGSSNILSKGWWESVAEGKFERGVAVNIQPLADSIDAWIKWLSSDEYVTDEEQKQLRLQAFLVTLDMATKAGFGVSSRTLTRMYNGFKGLKKEGYELEHIYNILSTPRQTTSWFVGRPRKDEKENMKKYVERVSGMQKVVKGLGKGEDISKIRKQYIDRMDELMLYGTDFDYDKFKEDKSMVNKYTKRLPITRKGQVKEGRQAPTPEDFWKIGFMYNLASYAEKSERTLSHPMKCNWDNDGANERRDLYELADMYVQTFYRIKDAKSEEDIRDILSVFVEETNKRSLPQLEAAGIKNTENVLLDVDELMQAREELIEKRKSIKK